MRRSKLDAFGSISGLPQQQEFLSSGSFTVPRGITRIRVKIWGGGGGGAMGGGCNTLVSGETGGTSRFGNMLLAYGGSGGVGCQGGIGGFYSINGGAGRSKNGGDGLPGSRLVGGLGGLPADGGRISGVGGSGGGSIPQNPCCEEGGAGGGGGGYIEQTLEVRPGDVFPVGVGAGGSGAIGNPPVSSVYQGHPGTNGRVIVEW